MGTPLDDYESNSSGNAIIYQELLNKTNVSSLDNLESAVVNNRNLSNMTTNSLLNNIGTDPESMDRLNIEQQELETSRTNMLNKKTALMNQKSDLLKKEVLIDGKITSLETWIQNHPFSMWNYSNKINKVEVHYTSFGIMGIRISYRAANKAQEIVGTISDTNNSSITTIERVDFPDDEWLIQIQITNSASDTVQSVLCTSISFYTSKNPTGTPPKVTIPPSSPNNAMKNKIYYIDRTPRTWLQHKSNAEAQGATLACFENSIEINKMLSELGQDRFRYGSYYIGLYHPNALIQNNNSGGGIRNNVPSNKNSNWAWVDGTPYNPNSTNWNGGEPNNWGPGENVGQMYSNGKINDLTKTNPLVAIYQKKITNTTNQTIRKPGEHITLFSIKPLTPTYDFITSLDILQKTNAESSVQISKQAIDDIATTSNILDKSIKDVNDAIAEITINIEHIKSKRILLDKLNADGEKLLQNFEGFTNGGTNFLSSITSYIGMREGAANRNETTKDDSQNGAIDALETTNDAINDTSKEILDGIIELEQQEIGDAISEYVIKKDNIFTNVLTDYMLNDEKQNTIEGVYDKVSQQNADKMRKMEINTYYDKVYKEYTNILKVIIVVCIVLVPIVIANKKEILPTAISNFLIVGIIFLTIIYIISRFIDIYMRDNTNFDKLRIPYDREAASLQRSGTITRKNNLLSSFARTCIGEDCCPDPASGMVYDTVKNRCVAKETYADYNNGSVSGVYLDETFNGYFDGLLGKSDQQVPYSIVQPFMTREELSGASLNLSSDTKMMA